MAHYRKIDTRIWNDAKFCALSDDGKLLFLFILTHPHLTALGAMRATRGGLADERRWASARFTRAWQGVCPSLVTYDEAAACLWVPKFLRYNQPESPNVVKAWAKALDAIPECELRSLAVGEAQSICKDIGKGFYDAFLKAFPKAYAKAYVKSMPYQEQEQEQKQEQIRDDDGGLIAVGPRPIAPVLPAPESSSSGPSGRYKLAAQEAHALWSAAMPGVPPTSWAELQSAGRRRIAEFVHDCGGLDRVEAFIGRVAASDYLAGRKDMPPMSLFTAIGKYDRIMAGDYDNRTDGQDAIYAAVMGGAS